MHTLKLLCLAAVAAAAVAAQAAASPSEAARSAANIVTFEDSRGENPPGPDISTVVVSNNDAGKITFQINIPNRPTLEGEQLIVIYIDADNNVETGDPDTLGADYAVEHFMGEVLLYKWDGTTFSRRAGDPPQVSLIFAAATTALTISINAAELGETKRFNFGVLAISGIVVNQQTGDTDFSNARGDAAPDIGHGFWSYDVRIAPLRLVVRRFRATKPVAGRTYTVRLTAARSDTGAVLRGGRVRCVATVGGRRLPVRSARFVRTEAVCIFRVPATARGGTVRGSVTVVFEGRSVRRNFAARVG